jgi:hypothetical protein
MRRLAPALALLAVVASPAVAATASATTPGPKILSFAETPTTLPAAGGKVTIVATLKGAQVCQLELLTVPLPRPEPTWSHEGQICQTVDEQHIRVWPNNSSGHETMTFKLVVSFFPEHKRTQLIATKVFTIVEAGRQAAPATTTSTTTTTVASTTTTTKSSTTTTGSTTTITTSHGSGTVGLNLSWLAELPTPSGITYSVDAFPFEEALVGKSPGPPSVSGAVTIQVNGAVACYLPVTLTADELYSGEVTCEVVMSSTQSSILSATYLGDDGSTGSDWATVTPGSSGEVYY